MKCTSFHFDRSSTQRTHIYGVYVSMCFVSQRMNKDGTYIKSKLNEREREGERERERERVKARDVQWT